jgi:hypothetical protein
MRPKVVLGNESFHLLDARQRDGCRFALLTRTMLRTECQSASANVQG